MAKLQAIVDYSRCRPDLCRDGICPAVQHCEKKILKQDAPFEAPYRLSELCTGCGDCVIACPYEAIRLG
jgi:translation initiation factor RLI1